MTTIRVAFKTVAILFIAYIAGHLNLLGLFLDTCGYYCYKHRSPENFHVPTCRPPLPLDSKDSFNLNLHSIRHAGRKLDLRLKELFDNVALDSLVVNVVTPRGTLFTKGYGVQRANETLHKRRGIVDEHTIYRIASVTKLFTALELMILRERGALSWDDDITEYVPSFTYSSYGWARRQQTSTPEAISLRQIASHTAGIPRDFPPAQVAEWPRNMKGVGLPFFAGRSMPSEREVLAALRDYPLTTTPNSPPLYSNTGYALLGMAAVAANAIHEDPYHPVSFPELLNRDIFEPLGLNSSFFDVNDWRSTRMAVSSDFSHEVDINMKALDPSYGQMSSAADLTRVTQMLLNAETDNRLLRSSVVREWLRPSYAWIDDTSEVGLLWEIIKLEDSFGRIQRVYQKMGGLIGHNSALSFNPTAGLGVVVMMTGKFSDSERIVRTAYRHFQPVIEAIQVDATRAKYAGRWRSSSGDSHAIISVEGGSLWLNELIVEGNNILALLRDDEPEKVALVSNGRSGEFRLAKGYRPFSGIRHYGCIPLWVVGEPGHANGAPVDLIYFTKDANEVILNFPSAKKQMRKSNS